MNALSSPPSNGVTPPDLSERADALWKAWSAYQWHLNEGTDTSPDLDAQVIGLIEDLLTQNALEPAVELLMGREDLADQTETMERLQQHAQRQSWTREVREVRHNGRSGPLRVANLVAVPLHGHTTHMTWDEALARRLSVHVNQAAVQEHGSRAKVDLLFLPFLVVPEACTMVVVDRWRPLMECIVSGQGMEPAIELKRMSDEFQRVYEADHARLERAGVRALGQRFALGVAVYDADAWGSAAGLLDFLDELQGTPAWAEAFLSEHCAILPPMDLNEALVHTLATRLRLATVLAVADRGLQTVDSVAFLVPDDDLASAVCDLTPVVNGTSMEPVSLPANWLGMIGSQGVQDAMAEAMTGLDADLEELAPEDEDTDDVHVPLVPRTRPRVH